MNINLKELKEKYKIKVISNDDKIYGRVMTDEIPYDSRYFVLNLLDELFQELKKIGNKI
jgi:hypothetical protein